MNHSEEARVPPEGLPIVSQLDRAFAGALSAGDWDAAALALRQGHRSGVAPLAWDLRQADWYIAQKRWDEASSHLKALLALHPEFGVFQLAVRHNLASVDAARERFAGSVAWLSPVLEVGGRAVPPPADFRATQALWLRALHRLRELERLRRWAAQADALGQLDGIAAGIASLASWDMADLAACRRWAASSRRGAGSSRAPVEGITASALLALVDGDAPGARRTAASAVDLHPDSPRTLCALGVSELALGHAKEAVQSFERATRVAPDHAPAWRGLGWAQILSIDPQAAHRSFTSAMMLDDQDAEHHGGLAVALAILRREPEAREYVASSQALDPQSISTQHAAQLLAGKASFRIDLGALFRRLARDGRGPAPAREVSTAGSLSAPGVVTRRDAGDHDCKIAVVTPTFERAELLVQTMHYFFAQTVIRPENLHWFVLDDSVAPGSLASLRDERVHYRCLPQKTPLGAKRNQLNDLAMQWGADFICSMDDDDWYGPSYVCSMVALLRQTGRLFAGSSRDYYYHVPTGAVLRVGPWAPGHSCNGVLCYAATALDGRRYDDSRRFAEEAAFLRGEQVVQHPDIGNVHLALAHAGNTVNKDAILQNPQCHTALTLSHFPMRVQDQAFYGALTHRASSSNGQLQTA